MPWTKEKDVTSKVTYTFTEATHEHDGVKVVIDPVAGTVTQMLPLAMLGAANLAEAEKVLDAWALENKSWTEAKEAAKVEAK